MSSSATSACQASTVTASPKCSARSRASRTACWSRSPATRMKKRSRNKRASIAGSPSPPTSRRCWPCSPAPFNRRARRSADPTDRVIPRPTARSADEEPTGPSSPGRSLGCVDPGRRARRKDARDAPRRSEPPTSGRCPEALRTTRPGPCSVRRPAWAPGDGSPRPAGPLLGPEPATQAPRRAPRGSTGDGLRSSRATLRPPRPAQASIDPTSVPKRLASLPLTLEEPGGSRLERPSLAPRNTRPKRQRVNGFHRRLQIHSLALRACNRRALDARYIAHSDDTRSPRSTARPASPTAHGIQLRERRKPRAEFAGGFIDGDGVPRHREQGTGGGGVGSDRSRSARTADAGDRPRTVRAGRPRVATVAARVVGRPVHGLDARRPPGAGAVVPVHRRPAGAPRRPTPWAGT